MKTKHYIQSVVKNAFLILLLFASVAEAQIVNIPDANFKAKLLLADASNQIASNETLDIYGEVTTYNSIDTNGDGEIQVSEAALITYLNVYGSGITNLEGIDSFTNLKSLNCGSNQLTSLDLIGLTDLQYLYCQYNQLTTLDVSSLTNLSELQCHDNQLSSLNISGLTNISRLFCQFNQLTALDVSSLINLRFLSCQVNQLPNLNLNGLTSLQVLACAANPLMSLNLSSNSALYFLNCSSNQLTSLDTSNNNVLNYLDCSSNLLTSLNVNNNTALATLICSSNQLTSLDVNSNTSLNLFVCQNNLLTSLNLDSNIALTNLSCDNNQLNTLNVSNNVSLSALSCGFNQLTNLDVTNNTALVDLDCRNNQLTTLNVSNNISLDEFFCPNNQLTSLFLKNGGHEFVDFSGNPNIHFICADNYQLADIQNKINIYGYSNTCSVSSYCSFTPGGSYNTISGNIKYDFNNNGCDAGDAIYPNVRVNISTGTESGAGFTDAAGNYTFFTQVGSFAITPAIENPSWFSITPAIPTITFADNNNNTASQNFCIAANGVHPDVEIVIAPILTARPGFEATYLVTYKNKGNQTLSGNITFIYDDSMLDFVSATVAPATQNTGLLNWNYSDLLPFESRSFYITLAVNAPTAIPPVNIGDQLDFEATITPVIGDEFPDDNLFTFHQTVVGSFDPNDITCIEGEVVPPTEIGNYLHYIINFENTGTFPAENIVVRTEVDATKFDIGSLQLLDTSDSVDARINGNTVEFIFKNIDLEIGGHGHILLKIKTQDNLVTGDAVAKRADIFFDYNAPVDTGFANTVFQTLSNTDFETDASVVISPNPVHDELHVKADNRIESVALFDAQGRIVMNQMLNEMETKLNVSQYQSGIYFAKIKTQKGIKVLKIQKD